MTTDSASTTPGTDLIAVTDTDGVRTITLNRPEKRNALTVAMYDSLASAIAEACTGDGFGAILVRGAGGHFSGGNDLGDFLQNPPRGDDSAVHRFLKAISTCALPIVAAVEGAAVGVGTTMLLHCDLVYAAPDTRFHMPFVDLALVPEAGSSLLVPALMGQRRAAELLMLGEPMNAATAVAVGLANRVVDKDQLHAFALDKARTLAAKPRQAMRHTKALMKSHTLDHVLAAMQAEGRVFGEQLTSKEARQAFMAFFARK